MVVVNKGRRSGKSEVGDDISRYSSRNSSVLGRPAPPVSITKIPTFHLYRKAWSSDSRSRVFASRGEVWLMATQRSRLQIL